MRLLLHSGPIYAPGNPGADAMLIADGVIGWIGSSAGAAVHAGDADAVVDLDGAFVAPAFVDAHMHHTSTGMTLLGLDLRDITCRAHVLAEVTEEARRRRGRPIVGHGWDESTWSQPAPPTRAELDRASWGSVVYLSRIDLHSAIVSSALVALLPELESTQGFERSGRVTGDAHHLVRRFLTDQLPGTLRQDAQRATRAHAAAHGIAALHECAGPDINGADDLRALQALVAAEPGPELVSYWGQGGGPDAARVLGAAPGGDLFVDGALGSRTALLREPYADAPDLTGSGYLEAEQVAEHLVSCTRAGAQAGFHAIGDAALDIVVAGLQTALEQCGEAPVRALRHRIEHATMLTPEQAQVLAAAGAVASVQPCFDARWGAPGQAYSTRLGADRAAGLHDLAGMVRAGVSLALGSDSPVTPISPWDWVRAAMWIHRPESRLSGRAAFTAATRGGWRAAHRDDVGVLAVGAPATYAVWAVEELAVQSADQRVSNWSTDPRSGTPPLPVLTPGNPNPTCLATVLDGKPLYMAEAGMVADQLAGAVG